jgi:hypothetical protein
MGYWAFVNSKPINGIDTSATITRKNGLFDGKLFGDIVNSDEDLKIINDYT